MTKIVIQPGLTYFTRSEWGARIDLPRLGYSVNRLDRTEAIMHHTVIIDNDATPNRWETVAKVFVKMRQLQMIRPDLGLDVPYNFVAFHMTNGSLVVCEGRGLDRTGAHTRRHNVRGIATAGQGNFQIGLGISAYADHWSRWWGWLRHNMGMENLGSVHPTRGIAFGHIDLASTSCPGKNLYSIIPQLTFKEDSMLWFIKKEGAFPTFVTDGIHKWGIPSQTMMRELQSKGFVSGGTIVVSAKLFNRIRTVHSGNGSVGDATKADIEAITLRVLKRQKLIVQ